MKKVVVNRDDLKNNVNVLRNILNEKVKKIGSKGSKIIPVVKGNGYGLGLIEYSKTLLECDIDMLGIATFEEAEILVNEKLNAEILMLSPINDETELKFLIENDVIITIGSIENFKRAEKIAESLGKSVKAHTKIDVGLGRYGFIYNDYESIKYIYENAKNIKFTGIYSHLVSAQDKKEAYKQFDRFKAVLSFLDDNKFDYGMRHISASKPFLVYDEMALDAVRLGSVLTGRTPYKIEGLKTIGTYETIISEIREVPKGHTISYGAQYKTKKDMKVAVISTGYLDGFVVGKIREVVSFKYNLMQALRELKNVFMKEKFKVEINGKMYNIIGQVGMFHTVIDIKDDDVKIGDKVIIHDMTIVHINPSLRREYI